MSPPHGPLHAPGPTVVGEAHALAALTAFTPFLTSQNRAEGKTCHFVA